MENTMRHLKVHHINRFKSDNGKHRSNLPTLQRTLKSLPGLRVCGKRRASHTQLHTGIPDQFRCTYRVRFCEKRTFESLFCRFDSYHILVLSWALLTRLGITQSPTSNLVSTRICCLLLSIMVAAVFSIAQQPARPR